MTARAEWGQHCHDANSYCTLHDCACGCDKCDAVGAEARQVAIELRTFIGMLTREGATVVERAAKLLEAYPNGNR